MSKTHTATKGHQMIYVKQSKQNTVYMFNKRKTNLINTNKRQPLIDRHLHNMVGLNLLAILGLNWDNGVTEKSLTHQIDTKPNKSSKHTN